MPHDFLDDEDDASDATVVGGAELLKAALPTNRQHRPYLVVVSGKESVGKMHRIDGEMLIGRASNCALRVDEEGVSRRHAKMVCRPDGQVEVIDLGSTNGTFVNAERIETRVLKDGDKIQVGTLVILKFSYQDDLDEALSKNLYESATLDPLTRVANKKTFAETLAREHAFAVRHNRPMSLLMFDIDHFKTINDTYGHLAGDEVLQTFASIVSASIRTEDLFARYGGEEFALILRDANEAHAIRCAERLRQRIEGAEFSHEGNAIKVTCSVGVATVLEGMYPSTESLIQAADERLYKAKQGGRNRCCAK